MEALIKISTEEFNQELFSQLEKIFKRFKNGQITIAFSNKVEPENKIETPELYEQRLLKSIAELEAGNGISFTKESLEAYIKSLPAE